MADAACSGLTPMFFPERGDTVTIEAARAVCAACPVWSPCLDYALSADSPRDGILAGYSANERVRLRREHRTGLAPRESDPPRRRRVTAAMPWDLPAMTPSTTWTRGELLAARAERTASTSP